MELLRVGVIKIGQSTWPTTGQFTYSRLDRQVFLQHYQENKIEAAVSEDKINEEFAFELDIDEFSPDFFDHIFRGSRVKRGLPLPVVFLHITYATEGGVPTICVFGYLTVVFGIF